jgi:DNA anti-recombination protein RmuC
MMSKTVRDYELELRDLRHSFDEMHTRFTKVEKHARNSDKQYRDMVELGKAVKRMSEKLKQKVGMKELEQSMYDKITT